MKFLLDNWEWISPIVWEICVRLIPSKKSLSLINGVKNIVDVVVPNLKTTDLNKGDGQGEIERHK